MRFKKILLVACFGLIFATSAWAQPAGWAIFVPTGAQYNGSASADFYSEYVNQHFWCSYWDLSGIDHFSWTCCCAGDPGYLDPAISPYTYFDSFSLVGNYYDCDGQLLGSGVSAGSYMIVQGTGSGCSGGIGGTGTYPTCTLTGVSPAGECRVYFDWTPVKRSSNYCTTWPSFPIKKTGKPDPCKRESRGNPVNVVSGNKYEEVLDLSISILGIPFEFRRSYNSQVSTDGPLGYGWTHSYDLSLEVVETSPTTRIRIWDADGRELYFVKIRQTNSNEIPFTGESRVKDRLKQVVSTGEYFLRRQDSNLTYKFGSDGKLLQISDPNGNTQTFTYTGGLLTQISDNFGKSLTIQYNVENRISSITDPKSQSVIYEYTNGDLTKVTYPDTNFITYAYSSHNLTDKYDTNNNLIGHWEYDSPGRVITYYSHLENGIPQNRIDFSYGFLTSTLTNSQGATTYTTGIVGGIPVVQEIQGCSTCGSIHEVFNYSPRGDLTDVTSVDGPNQYTTHYVYDNPTLPWNQVGEVTQMTEALNWPEQRITSYAYTHRTDDPFLLTQSTETVKSVVDPQQNKVITTTYDNQGNIVSRQESGYVFINGVATSKTYTTQYQYNTLGQLTQINGPRTDVSDITTLEYYDNTSGEGNNRGQIKAIVNALSQRTEFSNYDANGNVGTITDPNGVITQRTYDERNRIKTITNQTTGAQTQYFYDVRGNFSYIILPVGNRIDFTYNLANKLTEIKDSLDNKIQYQYDVEGNRIKEEIKDPQGTLKKYLDFTYDAYNNLKQIINPDTTFTEYTYDGRKNRTASKDPRNNTTTYTYDPLSRLKVMTQPLSTITSYGYDTQDNQATITDPKGNTTNYFNDDFGRKNQSGSPDTGTTDYQYDEAGNLLQRFDAKETVVNYTYDALNRLTAIQFPADSTQNVTFTYDSTSVTYGIGRLTGRTDPSGTYVFYYDGNGNLTKEEKTINSVLYTTQYTYDNNNILTSITYPSGRVVTYTPDQIGRISQVSTTLNGNPKTLASSITYLPYGGITGLTYGNGLTLTQGYDNQYRISSIVTGSILNLTYGYDANGNITSILDGVNPSGGEVLEIPGAYSYQSGTNKLTHIEGTPSIDFGYDANANITSETGWTYVYDLSNQLIRVLDNTNQVAEYTYNGAGQRIKKVTQTETRIFHYDLRGHLIAETNQSGQTIGEYIYLGDQLLSMIKPGESVYYFHNDHLGTPQVLTDDSQTIAWKAVYTLFGEAVPSIQTVENPFRYPGQYYDQETGLHYNYFRYYNPQTGRYITPDPIGLEGGINLFLYVAGNPVNFIDPQGLLYGIDMGESYGEKASLYWATLAINPNNAWYQTVAYTTMGLFASLWTPNTSEKTFETLLTAYLIGKANENLTCEGQKGTRRFQIRDKKSGRPIFRIDKGPVPDEEGDKWHYHRRPDLDKHRPYEGW
jgi:RHS repeat-associated protein